MAITVHLTVPLDDVELVAAIFKVAGTTSPGAVNEVHITDADDWSVHVDKCPSRGTCTGPAATA